MWQQHSVLNTLLLQPSIYISPLISTRWKSGGWQEIDGQHNTIDSRCWISGPSQTQIQLNRVYNYLMTGEYKKADFFYNGDTSGIVGKRSNRRRNAEGFHVFLEETQ
jgi:hypothetical protein